MNQCDTGMLSVPPDWRDRANDESPEQPIQTRSFEFLAESRSKSENEQDTHDFEGVDPSAQKSKADKQSSQRPVKRKLRTLSTASQNVNVAAIQKKIDNASVVMTNAPTLKMGVTLNAIAVQKPTFS